MDNFLLDKKVENSVAKKQNVKMLEVKLESITNGDIEEMAEDGNMDMTSIESLLVYSQSSLIKANLLIKVSKVIVTKMSQKPKRKLMIEKLHRYFTILKVGRIKSCMLIQI